VCLAAGTVSACAGNGASNGPTAQARVVVTSTTAATVAGSTTTTGKAAAASTTTTGPRATTTPAQAPPPSPSSASSASGVLGGLRGKTILVDPGHNGGNGAHASFINQHVFVGNGYKACDTTGTQTNDGYTEAAYTFDVATRLAALLRAAGATVVLTRPDNNGYGPCITERAAIGNRAHADAAISVHADGGPPSGRGFHVIEPAPVAGYNTAIVVPSDRLALHVRRDYQATTGMPFATYTASNGLEIRSDLGGLNLSTVPKVFIETGNMRNSTDAAQLRSPDFRQKVAQALAQAFADFLSGR
jgi:N-acetylmuramoyl-L-alanine amidase